jgi:hypothetical protein
MPSPGALRQELSAAANWQASNRRSTFFKWSGDFFVPRFPEQFHSRLLSKFDALVAQA